MWSDHHFHHGMAPRKYIKTYTGVHEEHRDECQSRILNVMQDRGTDLHNVSLQPKLWKQVVLRVCLILSIDSIDPFKYAHFFFQQCKNSAQDVGNSFHLIFLLFHISHGVL